MSQSNGPVNECEYEKENQSALCTNFFANPEIKLKIVFKKGLYNSQEKLII